MKTLEELQALPDEELRVMLAGLVGTTGQGLWHTFKFKPKGFVTWNSYPHGNKAKLEEIRAAFMADGDECQEIVTQLLVDRLPNYPQDLNACHEAEKAMHDKQEAWIEALAVVTNGRLIDGYTHYADVSAIAHAAARQRTIALILTLQKP